MGAYLLCGELVYYYYARIWEQKSQKGRVYGKLSTAKVCIPPNINEKSPKKPKKQGKLHIFSRNRSAQMKIQYFFYFLFGNKPCKAMRSEELGMMNTKEQRKKNA
jgi:hypothetical protein